MSYKFRSMQNKIDGSVAYRKWMAKPMVLQNKTTAEICSEISHSTTVTESDVRGAFAELAVVMREHLLNNESVKLDGIGVFSVGLSSMPVTDLNDFKVDRIKGAHVNFLPETEIVAYTIGRKGERIAVKVKKLLKGIVFEKSKYDTVDGLVDKGEVTRIPDKTPETPE